MRSSMDEEDAPTAPQHLQPDPTARAEAHHQQAHQAPASSHLQPAAPFDDNPSWQSEGQPSISSADSALRQEEESHRRTMWQRLKGLVGGGSSGEPGSGAASSADPARNVTTGVGRAEPDQAADDRLSAGRILERSASGTRDARGSAGATELTEQLFGPGPGAALAQSRAAAAAGEGSSGGQPNSGAAGTVQPLSFVKHSFHQLWSTVWHIIPCCLGIAWEPDLGVASMIALFWTSLHKQQGKSTVITSSWHRGGRCRRERTGGINRCRQGGALRGGAARPGRRC